MNTWSGIGNLVRDPEMTTTQSGVDVCRFTIAVNRPKDANGNQQADFIPIKVLGKRAAPCRDYLAKGRKVGITGRLQTYSYTAQDGQKKYGFEILMSDLTFLPASNANGSQSNSSYARDEDYTNSGAAGQETGDGFTQVEDDDLPF